MIVGLLRRFEPESEGLLREISARTSDQMLRKIAEADHGQDVDKHLAALLQIRETGTFPKEMAGFRERFWSFFDTRSQDVGIRNEAKTMNSCIGRGPSVALPCCGQPAIRGTMGVEATR